jgi:hypothetical protein
MSNRFRSADPVATTRALVLLCCVLALAACRREPPPTERPPEPQAAAAHTELRDAIQAPQDKARAVQKTVHDAASQQQAQIDAAEGG